jgi:hypothetical protein
MTDVAISRISFTCGLFADNISEPTNETFLTPRIVDYLSHNQMGTVRVVLDDIVLSMISRFYDGSFKMPWSLGSGNLQEHVHKIVRTYDCFLRGLDVYCVFFNLTHSFVDGKLAVSANIDWQLPRITFSALPTELLAGDVYRIVPHFANPSIGAVSRRAWTTHEDSITYTITKSPLPLEWDPKCGCFFATVPSGTSLVETELCAKIVTPLYDGVHFERTSRYSLCLSVPEISKPAANAHDIPRADEYIDEDALREAVMDALAKRYPLRMQGPQPSLSATGQKPCMFLPTRLRQPRSDSVTDASPRKNIDSKIYDIAVRGGQSQHEKDNISSWKVLNTPQISPTKRKASRPVRVFPTSDRDLDYWKRQKLEELNDPDLHMVEDSIQTNTSDLHANADAHPGYPEVESPASKFLAEVAKALWGKPSDEQDHSPKHHLPDVHNNVVEIHLPPQDNTPYIQLNRTKHTAFPWQREDNYIRHSSTLPMDRSDAFYHRSRTYSYSNCPLMGALLSPVDSAIDDTVLPVGAGSSASPESEFDQAQIQHNYMEFEERQKRKAAEKAYYAVTIPGFDGIISPSDMPANENDKNFYERVFLDAGSSDGRTSDIDGVSEEGDVRDVCSKEGQPDEYLLGRLCAGVV